MSKTADAQIFSGNHRHQPLNPVQDRPGNRAENWYRENNTFECTGTRFYQLCLDQSEIALKVDHAQD
jgi:hypothetical protein